MYANVLRAGTLTDARVIRLVSANFVPTHFNNNDPTRDPAGPSAVLWRAILRQKDLQGQGLCAGALALCRYALPAAPAGLAVCGPSGGGRGPRRPGGAHPPGGPLARRLAA